MSKIITPYHYKIYERQGTKWFTLDAERVFYNGTNQPLDLQNVEREFGLFDEQIVIELFRVNGGKPGFYLGNLRDRKFYYCGLKWEDIKTTIIQLGIGRAEPQR